MSTTIKQVAAMAGVTPTVVSHVLHGKAKGVRVSAGTAERVRTAAQELGYRVNVVARGFREKQTKLIGIVSAGEFLRPRFASASNYFAHLADGIIDGAFTRGYSVCFCPELFSNKAGASFADGRFDGLIWYSTAHGFLTEEAVRACPVPLLLIHTHSSRFGNRVPAVICDNRQGIELAVDHLWSLGHRRIKFAHHHQGVFGEARERQDAFVESMTARNVPVQDSDLVDISPVVEDHSLFPSVAADCTAIVCAADWVAENCMRAADKAGVRIPQDLSIVGFDSTSFCDVVRPRLTAVGQPLMEMGRLASTRLIDLIKGEVIQPLTATLPCSFDVRESTATTTG